MPKIGLLSSQLGELNIFFEVNLSVTNFFLIKQIHTVFSDMSGKEFPLFFRGGSQKRGPIVAASITST